MWLTNLILFCLKKHHLFKSNNKAKQHLLNDIKQNIKLYNKADNIFEFFFYKFDIIYKLFKFDIFKLKINATNKNFSKCLAIQNKQIIIQDNDKIKHCSKFSNCLNLKNVVLDSKCVTAYMFQNCISLEKVFLKNTQQICCQSFTNCISLKKIYIPKNIQCIEKDSFKNCLKLTKIVFY